MSHAMQSRGCALEITTSIADIQTKVVKEVISNVHPRDCITWLIGIHSYYTISANPIYMDSDYNSPLSYCCCYCNLSNKTMHSGEMVIEPTYAHCMVGSYASLSVCLSGRD